MIALVAFEVAEIESLGARHDPGQHHPVLAFGTARPLYRRELRRRRIGSSVWHVMRPSRKRTTIDETRSVMYERRHINQKGPSKNQNGALWEVELPPWAERGKLPDPVPPVHRG